MLLPLQLLNLLEAQPVPPEPSGKRPSQKNNNIEGGGAGGKRRKEEDEFKVMKDNEEILNLIKIFTQTQFFH